MSTQYLVRARPVEEYLEFDQSRIPLKLVEQAEQMQGEKYFVIGTRFSNGESAFLISNYPINSEFYRGLGITKDDVRQIAQSGKQFYSKWNRDSPLLLHDKVTRFLWHTAGRDFWEMLPRDIKVENLNNDLKINTLGNLFDALYGPNATMEVVESMRQGIYSEDTSQFPSWWLKTK